MLVVLDTNVLISSFISPNGAPAQIFDLWQAGEFDIATSHETLDELQRVLRYPKIRKYARFSDEQISQYMSLLQKYSVFVEDLPDVHVIPSDPADDVFLAVALNSGAQYIISGDDHLLHLGEYQGILIVTPSEFLSEYFRD